MANTNAEITASVILIGNELLSGRTQDANLSFLGKQLDRCGIKLLEARVIPDVVDDIVGTVNEHRAKYDYVFTTGGIGPTHDDITTECIAQAFGVPVVLDDDAESRMKAYYDENSREFTESRRKMARIPQGARLIDNPISAAPGYQIENVCVLAGIPSIMRVMFESMQDRLAKGPPNLSRAVGAFLAECKIAAGLERIQARYPQLSIGSYPFSRDGRYGTSLVLRGTDADALQAAVADVKALAVELGEEPHEEG